MEFHPAALSKRLVIELNIGGVFLKKWDKANVNKRDISQPGNPNIILINPL